MDAANTQAIVEAIKGLHSALIGIVVLLLVIALALLTKK